MERKEFYKHRLPHFQQPGQAYFVTWCLNDSVPKKALKRYTDRLELLKMQMVAVSGAVNSDSPKMRGSESAPPELKMRSSESAPPELQKFQQEYYLLRKKYIKAFDDLLDAEKQPAINLSKPENTKAIVDSLLFWEGQKLENFAFCVMPNHVHWVFKVFEKDNNGEPVYLQDVLYSVKRFTANQINKIENRKGELWQKESFDTTIRDDKHEYYAIRYTLNNPVVAGFVMDWKEWPGNWCSGCGGF